MRATRYQARFLDPTGARFGLPTFPWRGGPPGYATRRQLRARGLSPGGHPPAAQVLWRGVGGTRAAYLYRLDVARPKRTASVAVLAALECALRARRTCPTCRMERPYYIARSLGECLSCAPGGPL
jgi:hypothetical protein